MRRQYSPATGNLLDAFLGARRGILFQVGQIVTHVTNDPLPLSISLTSRAMRSLRNIFDHTFDRVDCTLSVCCSKPARHGDCSQSMQELYAKLLP
jgi:hypothetical protein